MTAPDIGRDRLSGRSDDVYAALTAAHAGLSDAESQALNARLVLLLANAVGDADLVIAAIEAAHGLHRGRDGHTIARRDGRETAIPGGRREAPWQHA